MKFMHWSSGIVFLFVTVVGGASTQPASAPGEIRLGAVRVDRNAGKVMIPARVVKPTYMLEFLLCQTATKDYESLLATPARAHQVHAALLLLGLAPGKPADDREDQFTPPRGARMRIEVRWKDPEGRTRTGPVVDWLRFSEKNKKGIKPDHWVFVGSDVLPRGGYAADQNGGIIAVANVPDAVIDVPVPSTPSLREREFVVNTKRAPPEGTEVELILIPGKNARRADHARALLEIDAQGRMRIDGAPISMDKLSAWAETFSDRHKYARVVIRSDARTPAGYAPQARLELKLGGIYEFAFRTVPPVLPLLPRTQPQLDRVLRQWRQRMSRPEDQLVRPTAELAGTLEKIRRQREELKKLDALWSRYAEELRGMSSSPPSRATETK